MRAFLLSAMLCPWGLTHAQDIVRGEYWVDTDPGFGTAIAFDPALIPAPDVLPTTIIVDLSGYEPGFHVIGFRTQDALLQWSLTNLRSVVVVDSTQGQVVEIEYFWDTDPGFGLSSLDTVLANPAQEWADTVVVGIPWGTTPWTDHYLFMRSKDDGGRWSLTNLVDTVYISGSVDVVDLASQSGIAVHPNPFAEVIMITPSGTDPLRFILHDAHGRVVHDKLIVAATTVELAGLSAGAYQAFFWQDRKTIHALTLIKE